MAEPDSPSHLSGETFSLIFSCVLSCIVFVGLMFLLPLILQPLFTDSLGTSTRTIGYISAVVVISGPIGLYGSCKDRFWALLSFYILSSSHLYALIIYVWLSIRSGKLLMLPKSRTGDPEGSTDEIKQYQIIVISDAIMVASSIILVCFKMISATKRLAPTKVEVVSQDMSHSK